MYDGFIFNFTLFFNDTHEANIDEAHRSKNSLLLSSVAVTNMWLDKIC
jgi:hypothetical protein